MPVRIIFIMIYFYPHLLQMFSNARLHIVALLIYMLCDVYVIKIDFSHVFKQHQWTVQVRLLINLFVLFCESLNIYMYGYVYQSQLFPSNNIDNH